MNEQTRWFAFKTFAWIYYWTLRFRGRDPAKPHKINTFMWGDVWDVRCHRLESDSENLSPRCKP